MIINDHFGGLFTGEDVSKDLESYLNKLRNYNEGKYYDSEKIKYAHEKIPQGYNIDLKSKAFQEYPKHLRKKINAFWGEEHRRSIEGFKGMCGLQYGYRRYCKLRGGKGPMQYRRFDNWYFNVIEERMWGEKQGTGIIEIGRRRSGKSSKLMWLVIQVLRTMSNVDAIVTSKTEEDAKRVLIGEKAQFIYQHLPIPLKPTILNASQATLHLGKKEKDQGDNPIITGRNSKVVAKSPKPEALEGGTLWLWIHDEIGKTKGLYDLYSMTNPALFDANGLMREGLVILTGVAGDRDKFSDDQELWKGADEEKLTRVFSPGWTSLFLDEFGEEDVEAAVRFILQTRHEIVMNKSMSPSRREKKLVDHQQQFPLTIDEAFLSKTSGKWNNMKINAQLNAIEEAPAELFRGTVSWQVKNVKPIWTPIDDGNIIILEHPQPGAKYISGVDCYGLKQSDSGSEGCNWIYKLENTEITPYEKEQILFELGDPKVSMKDILSNYLKLGDLPVAYYLDSPKDPSIYAENCAILARYYSTHQREFTKILVETEPPSILDHLMKFHKQVLMKAPLRADKNITKADLMKYGVAMKGYWTEVKYQLTSHYVENMIEKIFFPELLSKMLTYDETDKKKKWDIVDGFGVSLIMRVDKRIKDWNSQSLRKKEETEWVSPITFRRN